MFTAQGSSVFQAIEVAIVQFAQVRLVEHNWERPSLYTKCDMLSMIPPESIITFSIG